MTFSRVLDRIALLPMATGRYVRCFQPAYGDVLTPTPAEYAIYRMVPKSSIPEGVTEVGAIYLAAKLECAAWETVLRDVTPDDAGGVILDPLVLAKYAVQEVELVEPSAVHVVRLEPAARRHVIAHTNHRLNQYWNDILEHDWYELTHVAAGLLQLQCLAEPTPVVVPGVSWRSRQADADIVYVLYAPPFDRSAWRPIEKPISLGTEEGYQLLRQVLAKDHMVWLNDPGAGGGMAPPGTV